MTCEHLTCQQGRACRSLHRITLCEQEGGASVDTDKSPTDIAAIPTLLCIGIVLLFALIGVGAVVGYLMRG